MKYRIILFTASLLFSIVSYGQRIDKNSMRKLTTQCSQILEYNQQIETLRIRITEANHKKDSLRNSWRQVCMDYLQSSEQKLAADFKYLIANTDSIFDGIELYNHLLKASMKVNNEEVNYRVGPAMEPNPENNGPQTVVQNDDEDGKYLEKDDEKVNNQKPSTPPVENEEGDLDGIKSTIESKGKK